MPQTATNVPPAISSTWKLAIPAFIIFAFYFISASRNPDTETTAGTIGGLRRAPTTLKTATWNIAAINNNPFEYWVSITTDKKLKTSYNDLMEGVAAAIKNPSEKDDKKVSEVFTQDMFDELIQSMKDAGIPESDLAKVETRWTDDFKGRKIISEFIKDGTIGKKRLASMPDRYTNTIKTKSGMVYRPTVINCYDKTSLTTQKQWWSEWKKFMFATPIEVTSSKSGSKEYPQIFKLLKTISRAKYPAVTEEEEKISIPLQTVAAAIFDGVLVSIMNSQEVDWENLRSQMCAKLNKNKSNRITEIISEKYNTQDVIFLQEVSTDFLSVFGKRDRSPFNVHTSKFADNDRNQNSVILLKKSLECSVTEVTSDVTSTVEKAPFAKGDLFIVKASCNNGDFLYASFHGDTDGLATIPIVRAVKSYADNQGSGYKLVFGMDANSHSKVKDPTKQLPVLEFAKFYKSVELTSCYGDDPDPANYTTFHARTYLQPQLNKAITYEERDQKGDKNPKDHILFSKSEFTLEKTSKDNTGNRKYVDGMVFPTFEFPSDHGVTSAILQII
eukprot:TRINITY_DN16726_c0_g1_i1.p1 TRINITY_DN16726_c0_g1~~TRINITY_DN16726_c0_g1_i1.p1  ORF type:complete len:558 (+),score=99.49 TRINITY_DN16726_c0_g1_i1:71-1744(+)